MKVLCRFVIFYIQKYILSKSNRFLFLWISSIVHGVSILFLSIGIKHHFTLFAQLNVSQVNAIRWNWDFINFAFFLIDVFPYKYVFIACNNAKTLEVILSLKPLKILYSFAGLDHCNKIKIANSVNKNAIAHWIMLDRQVLIFRTELKQTDTGNSIILRIFGLSFLGQLILSFSNDIELLALLFVENGFW
jgi:hypothetical protein